MIEDRCIDFPPFAVFAEATTTNGKYLLPFKRGAFQGMRTVIPCFFEFDYCGQIRPVYDVLEILPLIGLLYAQITPMKGTLHIMPEFCPNSIMLDRHSEKGDEPWQIYAWCVRDVISKYSGLEKVDNNPLEDKFAYFDFMHAIRDHMQVTGRTFMIDGTYDETAFSKVEK